MSKNESFLLIACVWLAIFLIVLGVAYECLRRENRELRAVVAQQDINDELLGTVDKLTEKLNELNGGE